MVCVRTIGVNNPTTRNRLDGLFEVLNANQFELVALRMNEAHWARTVSQLPNSLQKGGMERDCPRECTARTNERILPPLKSTDVPFVDQLTVGFL